MAKFIFHKIVHTIVVLLGITLISFVLAKVSEIDPAEAYARREYRGASEEKIAEVREELGFDKSVSEQYMRWLKHAFQLDFGNSYISHKPVAMEIITILPNTICIAAIAALAILIIAVPMGMLSAAKPGGIVDTIVSSFSFLSLSIPGYFLGLICIYTLGYKIKIFPVIGHGNFISIIFAALVLAAPMIGSLSKMLRSLLLKYQKNDFVTYALSRGISKRNIMVHHLLRNAAPPCLTMFGQNVGYLIAGTAVVETIFSCSGLGTYALNATMNRDFPVVTAYMFLTALFFVVCNLCADFGALLINPKSRQLQEETQ